MPPIEFSRHLSTQRKKDVECSFIWSGVDILTSARHATSRLDWTPLSGEGGGHGERRETPSLLIMHVGLRWQALDLSTLTNRLPSSFLRLLRSGVSSFHDDYYSAVLIRVGREEALLALRVVPLDAETRDAALALPLVKKLQGTVNNLARRQWCGLFCTSPAQRWVSMGANSLSELLAVEFSRYLSEQSPTLFPAHCPDDP